MLPDLVHDEMPQGSRSSKAGFTTGHSAVAVKQPGNAEGELAGFCPPRSLGRAKLAVSLTRPLMLGPAANEEMLTLLLLCSRALLETIRFFFPAADAPSQTNAKYKPPPFFSGIELVYVDESEVEGFGVRRSQLSHARLAVR